MVDIHKAPTRCYQPDRCASTCLRDVPMASIYGNFVEAPRDQTEYLKIRFSPTSMPIQKRWRNDGLSADFLADYFTTFFPGDDAAEIERQAEIKDMVSYVANELLENAMKFSHTPSRYPISLEMYLRQDHIHFYVSNGAASQNIEAFKQLIEQLLVEDSEMLYLEQLMRHAESDSKGSSGIGYLTMLNNYGVELAWKLEPIDEDTEVVKVTTMVQATL